MSRPPLIVKLPPLHAGGQEEVARHLARFKVVCCGRRWGKSALLIHESVRCALGGGRVWIVAPSFPVLSATYRDARALVRPIPKLVVRESEREIAFPGGGSIKFRSADEPQSLRGDSLDLLAFDEAAFADESAWTEALAPCLTDRHGRALFASTPHGRNWFARLFEHGLDESAMDWKSWRFPSWANPFLPVDEQERARVTMSERTFRQEHLAEILSDGAGVFRGVSEAARGSLKPPERGRLYRIGFDPARVRDWSVAVVVDVQAADVVAFERWTGTSWELTVQRVAELAKRYNGARVNVDSTGLGDPVLEALGRAGVHAQGVKFTSTSKAQMVERLALLIERGRLTFPPIPVLVSELEGFAAETGPAGVVRYAGTTEHDDAVCALMLATMDLSLDERPDDGIRVLSVPWPATRPERACGRPPLPGWENSVAS